MTENNTIAIWCEEAADHKTSVELHVNLWHFSDKHHVDFFDLGIMPDDPNALQCIKVFLPIQVAPKEVKDLGPTFRFIEIAQGIFNETLSCNHSANGKCVELHEENSAYCQVHIFSQDGDNIDEDELTLKSQANGTLLTITQQALKSLGSQSSDVVRGYFRLRIIPYSRTALPFLTVINPKDRAWNSGFDIIEYIDCRINEARTLPLSIEDAFRASEHGVAKTRLIAFLAVVPVAASVTSSHAEWHKSRLLEKQIWERYVPDGLQDGMVVYHWKKNFDEIKDKRFAGFSAFVKLQTRKSTRTIIGLYLSLAIFLGIVGSLTANLFWYLLIGSSGAP